MARSSVSGRGESPGSVTVWIGALRNGRSDEAAHRLWDRYFRRLVGLARVRLRSMIHGPDDEEDAALSALRRPLPRGCRRPLRSHERPRRSLASAGRDHLP
ncbi:MAG: ECF-type sigma factor [Isosphaeraceae bacterium]